MKDAFGGIVNIVLIALFLIIVEGILGMVVNYTKAFKMKNIVIASIEKYEGNIKSCTSSDGPCYRYIKEGAKGIGYSPASLSCPSSFESVEGLFCYDTLREKNGKVAYRVVTQVDINIPIIRNIMSLDFFQVTGDTRMIERP